MTDSNDGRVARFIALVIASCLLLLSSPFIAGWLIVSGAVKEKVDEEYEKKQKRKRRRDAALFLQEPDKISRKNFQKN